MEIFAFGMLAGGLLGLIVIGAMNVAMDKGESSEYRSNDCGRSEYNRNNSRMDRHHKILEIKELAKRMKIKLQEEEDD